MVPLQQARHGQPYDSHQLWSPFQLLHFLSRNQCSSGLVSFLHPSSIEASCCYDSQHPKALIPGMKRAWPPVLSPSWEHPYWMSSCYVSNWAVKTQPPTQHGLEPCTAAPLVNWDPDCDFISLCLYPLPLQVLTSDYSLNKLPGFHLILNPRNHRKWYHQLNY